jgi:WD40 repeat protein
LAASGETLLVSGGNDGTLSLWSVDGAQASREALPKLSVKVAHDGGVYGIELARVQDEAPQLVSIGADKTLAIWDTVNFKVLSVFSV